MLEERKEPPFLFLSLPDQLLIKQAAVYHLFCDGEKTH